MASAIFEENGSARLVGQRKWQAKQRSEQHGGLLFAAGPSPPPLSFLVRSSSAAGRPFTTTVRPCRGHHMITLPPWVLRVDRGVRGGGCPAWRPVSTGGRAAGCDQAGRGRSQAMI